MKNGVLPPIKRLLINAVPEKINQREDIENDLNDKIRDRNIMQQHCNFTVAFLC